MEKSGSAIFIKHLEEASQKVSSWPEWKQTLLGGRIKTTESQTKQDTHTDSEQGQKVEPAK